MTIPERLWCLLWLHDYGLWRDHARYRDADFWTLMLVQTRECRTCGKKASRQIEV